ncbi:hypothetical protein NL676_012811 [Syzygium grande]|nr:hypothetical protein NL676_012811 [Syzygium grande]
MVIMERRVLHLWGRLGAAFAGKEYARTVSLDLPKIACSQALHLILLFHPEMMECERTLASICWMGSHSERILIGLSCDLADEQILGRAVTVDASEWQVKVFTCKSEILIGINQ